jgi:hypothetical protein
MVTDLQNHSQKIRGIPLTTVLKKHQDPKDVDPKQDIVCDL